MEYLIEGFKSMFWDKTKQIEEEGHVLEIDTINNKIYIIQKTSENGWTTKWVNMNEYHIKTPSYSLSSIFT